MSIKLVFGPLPDSFDAEQKEFLYDILTQIQAAIETQDDLDDVANQPEKQADGMIRYSSSGFDFDDGPGFYGRIDGDWRKLSPAEAGEQYATVTYVDGQDSAHAALTAESNDVHGTLTYTNQQITVHKGETAAVDDVHGAKTYADGQDSAHAALTTAADDVHQSRQYADQQDDALSDLVLQTMSFAGYGGLYLDTPASFPNIGAAWQTINIFDQITPDVTRHVTASLVDYSIAMDVDGVWLVNVAGTFHHNSSNQGRKTYLRFWNIDQGVVAGAPIPIGTGRNAEITSFNFPTPIEVIESMKGDRFRLEIGGGDSYSSPSGEANIIFEFATYFAQNIGEWREFFEV